MCASHSGEPRHISRAQQMLKKTGAEQDNLACGGHPALNAAVNRGWIREGYIPTSICNNCSDKHAGMIAGAVSLDAAVHGYHNIEHPMQQRVKRAVEEMSGLSEDKIQWAVDGCNLPAPALPLRNLALMFARLAEARGGITGYSDIDILPVQTQPDRRTRYLAHIHESMSTHPDLVGGEGRFCTTLMHAYHGMLIGKVGADGCYGVAVRALSVEEGNQHRAIGIAVKVEDGNLDILYSAVMEILEQLNVGTSEMRRQLADWHYPAIINTAGVVTGGIRHHFVVKQVGNLR